MEHFEKAKEHFLHITEEAKLRLFAIENADLLCAVMALRDIDKFDGDLDDWECWLGDYVFGKDKIE